MDLLYSDYDREYDLEPNYLANREDSIYRENTFEKPKPYDDEYKRSEQKDPISVEQLLKYLKQHRRYWTDNLIGESNLPLYEYTEDNFKSPEIESRRNEQGPK